MIFRLISALWALAACSGGDAGTTTDGGFVYPDARMPRDAGTTTDGGFVSPDARVPRDAGPRPDVHLPPGTGWLELPNTRFITICPDDEGIRAVVGCEAVASAWGGGVADLAHDRLLLWGGGHNDYWGNEIYALTARTA